MLTSAQAICRRYFADTTIGVSTNMATAFHLGTETPAEIHGYPAGTPAVECLVPNGTGYWDVKVIVPSTGEQILLGAQTIGTEIEPRP